MARLKKTFGANSLLLDDGRQFEADPSMSGLGAKEIGIEQNRLRRAEVDADDFAHNYGGGNMFGPGRFRNNLLRDPSADGFFGLMQAKENAAAMGGMKFKPGLMNPSTGGFGADTSTALEPGQMALNGLQAAARPDVNAELRQSAFRNKRVK